MTYRANPADFGVVTPYRPAQPLPPRRRWGVRALWRGLVDALMTAHLKDAQCEVDRLVARRSGKLTDSLEREIGERMMRGDWNVRP